MSNTKKEQPFSEEFVNKFRFNPTFHAVNEVLKRGGNPYKIIEQMIENNYRLSTEIEESIKLFGTHGVPPAMFGSEPRIKSITLNPANVPAWFEQTMNPSDILDKLNKELAIEICKITLNSYFSHQKQEDQFDFNVEWTLESKRAQLSICEQISKLSIYNIQFTHE